MIQKNRVNSKFKLFIIASVCALLLNIGMTTITIHADESTTKEQTTLKNSMLDSITYDKNSDKLIMDSSKLAEKTPFSQVESEKLAKEFNQLTSDKQQKLMKDLHNKNTGKVAPIIIWAASVVGGWLAAKLLDWGAHKFCKTYKNYNSSTKYVCDIID